MFLFVVLTVLLECCLPQFGSNCWNKTDWHKLIFADIINQLKNLARLYSSDDDIGISTSDSAFFIKQRQWRQHSRSPPQSFHYNDQNMSHLFTVQMSASHAVAVSITEISCIQTGISASSIVETPQRHVPNGYPHQNRFSSSLT